MTEAQLRSWQPRSPATRLKAKVLNGKTPRPATPSAAWGWGVLAPAMACVLFTFMAFNHDNGGLGTKPMMSLVMSNQSSADYAAGTSQTAQNHLAGVTFEWTNRSNIQSIIGFKSTTHFIN